jgi:hypothetical protein
MSLGLNPGQYGFVRHDNSLKARLLSIPDPDSPEAIMYRLKADAKEKAERDEQQAATRLNMAKSLLRDGKKGRAEEWLRRIIREQSDTKAAVEAKKLLNDR